MGFIPCSEDGLLFSKKVTMKARHDSSVSHDESQRFTRSENSYLLEQINKSRPLFSVD